MKLDDIARLAGVSRTTASYVVNGKAKQYRVSDKTVDKVMIIVRQYNYHPNAVAAGLRAGRTHSIGLVIPDLENTCYNRVASYLERQARLRGYQLLIACSEDQSDNEMRCVEHLIQRQVDAIIVSSTLPAAHPFYQRWVNHTLPVIALDRVLDPQHFISVVGADKEDAFILAKELRLFSCESVLYFGALPELSVNSFHEQGFRAAWQDDLRKVDYLYANGNEREVAMRLFDQWLKTHSMPQALFTTSLQLLQGVTDVILKQYGRLPDSLVIATFDDDEFLDFLTCPILSVAHCYEDVAERVLELILACLNKSDKPPPGLTYVHRHLFRRGSLNRK